MKTRKHLFYKHVSHHSHTCCHGHFCSSSHAQEPALRSRLASKYGFTSNPALASNLLTLQQNTVETETDFFGFPFGFPEALDVDSPESSSDTHHVHGPGCTDSHNHNSTQPHVGLFRRVMDWMRGKSAATVHPAGQGPNLQGACFCGRGIAAFSQANSSNVEAAEHANHTPIEHAVEGNTTPSIFGIAIPGVFLPIKVYFDWKNYQKSKSLNRDLEALLPAEKTTSFAKVIKQRLVALRNMIPSAAVFYPTFISSIVGHALGLAKVITKVAQPLISISVFGFVVLAALSIRDGVRDIRSGIKALKSLKNIENTDYRKQVKKQIIKQIAEAAIFKVSSGVLIIAGLVIPGAQIAGLVGIGLAMFNPVKSLLTFIYHKVSHWLGKSHDHMHFSKSEKELCNDPNLRQQEFLTIQEQINDPATSKKDVKMLKTLREKIILLEIENRVAA
jgi:hypothetical protein